MLGEALEGNITEMIEFSLKLDYDKMYYPLALCLFLFPTVNDNVLSWLYKTENEGENMYFFKLIEGDFMVNSERHS